MLFFICLYLWNDIKYTTSAWFAQKNQVAYNDIVSFNSQGFYPCHFDPESNVPNNTVAPQINSAPNSWAQYLKEMFYSNFTLLILQQAFKFQS